MCVNSILTYTDIDRTIDITDIRLNILRQSISHRIPHLHECGGHGLCTTCRIRVIEGAENLSPPTSLEIANRLRRNWDTGVRLACQTWMKGGNVSIERLIWTNGEISNLQIETIPFGIGEERNLAILFCDMRNFTPLADEHSNFDLAHMLNRFFTEMGEPVLMNNGIIYQYAGDEIVALFGTTQDDPEKTCKQAVRAAMGMQYAIERLNKELREFGANLSIGIGLHYGKAFIGNVGHPRHKQFAVIGDTVNVTSRIQGYNKELQTGLLASEVFLQNLPSGLLKTGQQADAMLKGKKSEQKLFEVLGFKEPDIHFDIQRTLNPLLHDEARFAKNFYDRLFREAPEIKPLFTRNIEEQGKLLTHMLRGIVYSMSRSEHMKAGLKSLGHQHTEYGVKPEHYEIVAPVLLITIKETLIAYGITDVQNSWYMALQEIIDGMKNNLPSD